MIYEQIAGISETNPDIVMRQGRAIELDELVVKLRAEIETEDSKKREAELRELMKASKTEASRLRREVYGIEEEIFKTLLAAEYDFPREHSKFDKVYALAYQHGHSSSFSEIELYFMDFVELVKDDVQHETKMQEDRRKQSALIRDWQEFCGRLAKKLGVIAITDNVEQAVDALLAKSKKKRK